MTNKKELRNIIKEQLENNLRTAKITFCPSCHRGYLLDEEIDHIKQNGICYACKYFKDNNNICDEVTEICPEPVKVEWISGKARSEIPWIGTINLFFEDVLHGKNTVRNVHSDCLISLGVVIALLISIPIVWDIYDYLKEKKKKKINP